jgi:sulfur carrier protein
MVSMNILVNGESRTIEQAGSVSELLIELGLAEKRVAVERNGELVPKSRHAEQSIEAGDRIEIVQAIGGG